MNTYKKTVILAIIIGLCGFAVVSSSSYAERSLRYDVQPLIEVPISGFGNEAAIESHERIIHHFMEQSERNNLRLSEQLNEVLLELNRLSGKIDDLDTRISDIEVALGIIEQPRVPRDKAEQPQTEPNTGTESP